MASATDVYFPASTALVLHDGDLVLVKLRASGEWVLVGGTIDEGEDPAACIRREVVEETGLEVTHCALLFVENDPERDRRKLILDGAWADNFLRRNPRFDIERDRLVFGCPDSVYLVHAIGCYSPIDVNEVEEVRSFPLSGVPFSQIGRGHERYIKRYLQMHAAQ